MYDAISIEERNTPTVTLVNENFVNDAMSAASSRAMPGVRLVPESIVSECSVIEDIDAGITAIMDDVVTALTRPLTAEEKSPRPRETEKPARIIFKGNLAEINRFFYQRGWTDGLPVIPPTEEAVAEMLTGTDLPPDHLVAELEPRLGKATVEKIAINAVMAGALPTYMPLLIAGVKALVSSPGTNSMTASTGSFAPFWIVNGPIRKDLRINHNYGTLSPGDIANATIGRTLGLIIKNIRGQRKGVEDMGVLGNPGKYTMVIAENEEDSPWEPLHAEHGFNREDSTISLSFPQSYQQMMAYSTDAEGILRTVIYNVMPGRLGILGLMLTPTNARSLASKGWTKQGIKDFIMENAHVPWDHHPQYWGTYFEFIEGRYPEDPQEAFSIIRPTSHQPDPIRLYVVGGVGSWIGLLSGGAHIVTEKAELPANWDRLVKKYDNVVPTYIRY